MKKILLLMSVAGALLISACSSDGTSGSSNADDEIASSSTKSKKISKGDSKTGDCLAKFEHDYAKMLTLDDVLLHQSVDRSIVETDVESIGDYGWVGYQWVSDRPDMEVEIMENHLVKMPDRNSITLTLVSFHDEASKETTDYFSRGYKKLSDDEIAALYANLEKSYAGKPEELEQAKGFLDMRKTSEYVEIPDVGTRSYWKWSDTYGGDLVTLVGRTQFSVKIKVSDNSDTNLDVAKKIAQEVMNKCL